MKRLGVIATALFTFVLVGCSEPKSEHSVQDIINQSKSAVFLVMSERGVDPFGIPQGGIGTGYLVAENQIITNAHVVEGSEKVTVKTEFSPRDYEVKIVFNDKNADVAVLEIVNWDIYSKENRVKYLNFADSSEIQTIDEVYAIGNPWGLMFSVSKGIISHVLQPNLTLPNFLIQTDAHVYNGNSGGPLLNIRGDIIGMNSLMMAQNGGSYGFAIHSNIVAKIIRDWKEFGMTRWAYMGVSLNNAMVIESVAYNSAAMLAGLKKGDKITEIWANGKRYNVEKPIEFSFVLASYQYNDSFEIMVERNGELHLFAAKPKFKFSSEYPQ